MSVLSENITIRKGDCFTNLSVATGQRDIPWQFAEKLASTAINECHLDKWPENAEAFVKSQLNAFSKKYIGRTVYIDEKPHPFCEDIVQIDFCVAGLGVIFTAFGNKKEEAKLPPPDGYVYGPYLAPTNKPAIGFTPDQVRYIQPQGWQEVRALSGRP